jgi:hypothetical protein
MEYQDQVLHKPFRLMQLHQLHGLQFAAIRVALPTAHFHPLQLQHGLAIFQLEVLAQQLRLHVLVVLEMI